MLLLIVVILLSISVGIIYPSVKKIFKLRQGISQIQSEVDQKYTNAQKLRRTMRELDSIKSQTEIFKQATVKVGNEIQIITELENLATKHNIDQTLNISLGGVSTKKAGTTNHPPLSQYYELSFLNNGTFADQVNYLQDLEKLSYYLIIKNVKFENRQNKSNTDDDQTLVTLSFSGIIYVEQK